MSFQPVIPGMGRLPRSRPQARSSHFVDASETARYRGQAPGQLVMGVHDLAQGRVNRSPFGGGTTDAGFYEHDAHGNVQEGTGHDPADTEHGLPPARDLYGSHGGRYGKTLGEEAAEHGGSTPSEMGYTASHISDHNRQVREVKRHWGKQPTVMLPTDAPLHTGQSVYETEGDTTPSGYTSVKTEGGSPAVIKRTGFEYTPEQTRAGAVPSGMKKVNKIADDLRRGGKIRKPAWVVKQGGRLYALDGHHRILAARDAGHSHVPVKLWDRDAEMGL